MKKLTKEILNKMMDGNVVFECNDFVQIRDSSDGAIIIDWVNKNTVKFATLSEIESLKLEEIETNKFNKLYDELHKGESFESKMARVEKYCEDTPDSRIQKIIKRKCDL